MKYYFITQQELDVATRRLNRLLDKKIKLFEKITNITSEALTDEPKGTHTNSDKMANYVAAVEEIDKEIKEITPEIEEYKEDLEYMGSKLGEVKELKEQIFSLFYIRGIKPKYIATKIPCDLSTVYKYLKIINKEKELSKKNEK